MSRPRIVIAGQVGTGALTDDLTLASVLCVLRSMDAVAVVVSPDAEQTHGVHGVATVDSDLPSLVGAAMNDADLALLVGDQLLDMRLDSLGIGRWLPIISIARAARTKVMPFGLQVTEPGSGIPHGLASRMVAQLATGLVTSKASKDALVALGGLEPVVAPDLLFALTPALVRAEDRIVVSLRELRLGHEEMFVRVLARQLDDLVTDTGLPVCFVSLRAGRDERLHQLVAESMNTRTEQDVADMSTVLTEFGRARVVITMHDQGVPGAILGGRPVVHLADEPLADLVGSGVVRSLGISLDQLGELSGAVMDLLGCDAQVIDLRDELRRRMVKARSVIERTLHAV